MKLTLLIDLDDTLLANNMEQFEPAYLKALSKHLSNHIKPEIMLRELLHATQGMIKNDRPDLTLEDAFDNAFYPAIGVSKTDLKGIITSFYEKVFPNLIAVTSTKPDAQHFINWAVSKGHRLAVATNPLFPRTAIYQRLTWAGFPPAQYPFQLISSYESFHFSKPNLAYYAEILAQLGWPQEPVIMVGNDYKDDILPAKKLGLTTFWVNKPVSSSSAKELDREQKSGDLYDLVTWLDMTVDIPVFHISTNQDALLAVLRANLAALQTLTGDILDKDSTSNSMPGESHITRLLENWTDLESCKYLPELKLAIKQIKPGLPENAIDTLPAKIQKTVHPVSAINELCVARLASLNLFKHLSPQDWEHSFQDPILSRLVSQWVTKDCAMLRELWKLVKETAY